jgi:hypothetical protein
MITSYVSSASRARRARSHETAGRASVASRASGASRAALASLTLLGLVVGCGGPSGGGSDWSGKALEPVSDRIMIDLAWVPISIDLPAGMKRKDGDKLQWENAGKWNPEEPEVELRAISKEVHKLTGGNEVGEGETVITDEKLADGFVFTTRQRGWGIVVAKSGVGVGDDYILCRASQANEGGVPGGAKTAAWLESICRSLKVVAGAPTPAPPTAAPPAAPTPPG